MRTIITADPFATPSDARPWRERGRWPAEWVALPAAAPPCVVAYRLQFTLAEAVATCVHVCADERYELFVDGARIARGPERGCPDLWYYESYDLTLPAGDHTFLALVWSLGPLAAEAQMSVRHSFLLAAEGEHGATLNTGRGAWEAKQLGGYGFVPPGPAKWRGHRVRIDGAAFDWGFERGGGDGWLPAVATEHAAGRVHDWEITPRHRLAPATLPPQIDRPVQAGALRCLQAATSLDTLTLRVRGAEHLAGEEAAWQALLAGTGTVTIAPHTTRRAIVDLGEYYCAYPELVTSGGAGGEVRVQWAEALRHTPDPWVHDKGHRDEVEGKFFAGFGDAFLPDGGHGRHFTSLWWNAGRYLEIAVRAGDEPLVIERFGLRETRYPLENESRFECDEPRLARITPILVRGMLMDAHETYADSPYYEELMYAGDTRLEMLCTYVMTRDERLPRKALRLFDASRRPDGLTQSRFPCRVLQVIAPFALWWVGMVRDYAFWRGDAALVAELMPGVRQTLEAFRRSIGPDGLLHAPEGWNTLDWVPNWEAGIPPDGNAGVSGLMNWQLVYVLTLAADLEARLGETEQATRYERQARELAARATTAFWNDARGLLADDLAQRHFSEHTQCMALLSGVLAPELRRRIGESLLAAQDIERATIYFSHYLFEVYRELGRVDAMFERFGLWYGLAEQGFKCPIESPEPSRSDCHAWGSHPLYHYFATVLGIRPASLGFGEVEVRPQLGPLTRASGVLVHPAGEIAVELRVEAGQLRGSVTLPEGLTGWLVVNGEARLLRGATVL
jgi:alpha-L-rhamnosidase